MLTRASLVAGVLCAAAGLPAAVGVAGAAGADDKGTITGLVHGAGFDLDSLSVMVDWDQEVPVASDGTYSVSVPAGEHYVSLVHEGDDPDGMDRAEDDAGSVTVAPGRTLSKNIGFTAISGTVTGGGDEGVLVSGDAPDAPEDDQYDDTFSEGHDYRMLVVADDYEHYIQAASAQWNKWGPVWYPNAISESQATPVRFVAGEPLTLDFALEPAGRVVGRLDLPAKAKDKDLFVAAEDSAGERVASTGAHATGKKRGKFVLAGLAAGTYTLSFARASGMALSTGSYYDQSPESDGVASAATIEVTPGGKVVLPATSSRTVKPAKIVGSIFTKKDGHKVWRKGLRVVAVPKDTSLSTRSAITRKDGSFAITGLSAGKYVVHVWNAAYPSVSKPYKSDKLGAWTVETGKKATAGAHRFDPKTRR